MKSLNCLSLLAVITLSLSVLAQNNPQIRVCHQTGGIFHVADAEGDQIGLCQYDSSIIGTIDLLNYRDNIQGVQSLQTYLDGIQSCEPYGQTKTIQLINNGPRVIICDFTDGSMIDAETLKTGRHDPKNAKLNTALELHL